MKALAIALALTLLVAFSAQAAPPVVDASTIAYWTFDDPQNLGADSVGNNHLSNYGSPTQGAGLHGAGSLQLDGASDLQFVPNAASTINNIPGGFTIELWAKSTLQAQSGFYVRRDGWFQSGGVWNELVSYFYLWGDDGNQWQTAHPRLDANGQWHHMIYVFDPANDVYYQLNDGVLVGQPYGFNEGGWATTSSQVLGYNVGAWTTIFALGAVENASGAAFTGSLDSVMISNRVTYDMQGNYIPIPEPTTISLLGLLALLIRKK